MVQKVIIDNFVIKTYRINLRKLTFSQPLSHKIENNFKQLLNISNYINVRLNKYIYKINSMVTNEAYKIINYLNVYESKNEIKSIKIM